MSPVPAPGFVPPRYIAVEGPIRVGKTSLARILADRLHARRILDSEDNPFLQAFYQERPGAGFAAQMYFLIERYNLLKDLDLASEPNRIVVSDFLFEKDKIFAYINLDDSELKVYDLYYESFRERVPAPDLVIYLQATPDVLKKRIAKKNHPREAELSEEYIEEVAKAYEHFFFHYTASDLLVVNTSEIDFVDRNEDLQELMRRLSQPVKGTQYFLPLGSAESD
jgi:deoxyadenosine/deoxycytidine kinase